ncbi:hypothetical protein DUNSADRAFT_2690 [Dunaliella salina]|uniref:Uncharacterized protein n=1 Tax=Dunaliella salina TaxID=3046 RepID=A0ABQ7H8A1_DUNSA|nr:hypothetical protein DUNSADRAFT_2690 [Dunaliella salina]|eukprot:KAF5843077.1 hypothetical protein DUNSADRAFT_2690 [Dunaliella salina]
MLPKSGPRPDLLPTGMDQCTFCPRTNFARHVRANPRPDPEAEQLRAFDDDDFFTAALGVSMPPSPARLAAFHSPGCPGGGGAVLAQRRQAASMQATGSPIRKKLADPSIRGSTETEGGASSSIVSNAPNALHSISDKLDWDEFLSRQYAFLSQQILRSMEESGAPASPSKPILSAGSAKIMLKKELEGEHYVPPHLRPLSPGRSDVRASAVSKGFSSSSQASYARDRVMGGGNHLLFALKLLSRGVQLHVQAVCSNFATRVNCY